MVFSCRSNWTVQKPSRNPTSSKIQNRFSRTPSNRQKREKGEIASRNLKPNRFKKISKFFEKNLLFY
ncbi:unnamed protein product, partial [Nesidiocoris tenuis]